MGDLGHANNKLRYKAMWAARLKEARLYVTDQDGRRRWSFYG